MRVNPKFYSIPEDKRDRIIRAAFKLFSSAPYKKVALNDIALEAQVSKALLIHYFYKKQNLYDYILNITIEEIRKLLKEAEFKDKLDLYDEYEFWTNKKMNFTIKYPMITDFITRVYMEEDIEVSKGMIGEYLDVIKYITGEIFKKVDRSKFRDFITAEESFALINWALKGMLEERFKLGDYDYLKMMDDSRHLIDIFRKMTYKDEFHK